MSWVPVVLGTTSLRPTSWYGLPHRTIRAPWAFGGESTFFEFTLVSILIPMHCLLPRDRRAVLPGLSRSPSNATRAKHFVMEQFLVFVLFYVCSRTLTSRLSTPLCECKEIVKATTSYCGTHSSSTFSPIFFPTCTSARSRSHHVALDGSLLVLLKRTAPSGIEISNGCLVSSLQGVETVFQATE